MEPVGARFRCNARFYRLPGLSISCVSGSPLRANRTRELAEGSQDLVLMMCLEGVFTASQLGREAAISGGGAVLLSAAVPWHHERTTSRLVGVGMPRVALAPMLSHPDAALMSVIPSTVEALRLLTGYIDLLINDATLAGTNEVRRVAVNHVHDLVAMTVGATRDAAEIAAGRGVRAARMRAIKTDIELNLEGDVSVATLAARHRVSPRYIRKLFEGEDTSLSQFVLGQRLTRVHRMLSDPRHADRTIGDIAFGAGFGDLSTFNREFRRRFGVTPSDVRSGRQ